MTNAYYNFVDPVEPGTIVDAFAYNREMIDITSAFDVLPPASQLTSGTLSFSQDTGVTNAYAGTLAIITGESYKKGNNVALKIAHTSTGASTLDLNALGAKPITMSVVGAVVAGDLKVNGIYTFVYDGSAFQCLEMSSRFFDQAQTNAATASAKATAATGSASTASTKATEATNSAISYHDRDWETNV